MKALFILAATIFLLQISYAATEDSVFVIISGDTVHIWNTGAYENCGCLFKMNVMISNDTISVTEVDTSINWAYCMCYFDLRTSVTGLQSATYYVNVFRSMPLFYPDTLFYIGSTTFIYGGSVLAYRSQSFQSDCYDITGIRDSKEYPTEFTLEQNYPNPFNPTTTIKFSIQKEVPVNLSVYNMLGEKVRELKNGIMKPGYYEVEFNALTIASGIYLYRISAGNFVQTKKMILLK